MPDLQPRHDTVLVSALVTALVSQGVPAVPYLGPDPDSRYHSGAAVLVNYLDPTSGAESFYLLNLEEDGTNISATDWDDSADDIAGKVTQAGIPLVRCFDFSDGSPHPNVYTAYYGGRVYFIGFEAGWPYLSS